MKFFNSFSFLIITFTFILIFSLCFFIPVFSQYGYISPMQINSNSYYIKISTSNFAWPTPGYNTITSKFGYRTSPTSGASSYHGGIDIAAPTGSNIIASYSGRVSFTGFSGAGGFTVTIKTDNLAISYSHVSPNFLVYVGQFVNQGEIIATVGPKNVYGVLNNPYKDSNGNPTNGATTGPHLHFSIKKDGKAVNPLDYF